MTKYLLASAMALAMTAGTTFAQSTTSETTTSTQSTTVPVPGAYSSSKSQKTLDSSGTETDKSQTYSSGSNGTKATSTTRTTGPDGSQSDTSHVEQTVSPPGDTTTTRTTT